MNARTLAAVSLSGLALISGGLLLGGAGSAEVAKSEAMTTAAAEGGFAIDNGHSSVVFAIQHNKVNDVWGRFNTVKGSFHIDPANLDKSSIDVTIDMDSVDTGIDGRDKHLRSPDFFSTKEFPTATFKSTKFAKTGENTFDVTGDFELHGVKKSLTVKVEYRGEGQGRGGPVSGLVATFDLPRADFGITKYEGSLGGIVKVTASLQGGK